MIITYSHYYSDVNGVCTVGVNGWIWVNGWTLVELEVYSVHFWK